MRWTWVSLAWVASTAVHAACGHIQLMTADAIETRLTPPGAGQVATIMKVAAKSGPLSGEEVYQQYCSVCHAMGVAGAPLLGDDAAWKPRVAKGMDVLLKHVVEGYNAMPAKGTCMACTESELEAAIEYMLDQ